MRVRGRALPNSVQMVVEFHNVAHPAKVVSNKKLLQGKRLSTPNLSQRVQKTHVIKFFHITFFSILEGPSQQRIEPVTAQTEH